MTKIFGIDISAWQKYYPYTKATKEGVKFAILRAGQSMSKDSQFEVHYKNAKKQGWGVGAYCLVSSSGSRGRSSSTIRHRPGSLCYILGKSSFPP